MGPSQEAKIYSWPGPAARSKHQLQRSAHTREAYLEILCFSHLRWDFVYQRPQHLLTRFASRGHVHFWEEPCFGAIGKPQLRRANKGKAITVLTPLLPGGIEGQEAVCAQKELLDAYVE